MATWQPPPAAGSTRWTISTSPTRHVHERPGCLATMRAGTGTAPSSRAAPSAPARTSGSRSHGHALWRGADPNRVMAELFGRQDGVSHGRGGSMHMFDLEHRFMGGYGIVGGNLPLAAGMALSSDYRGTEDVTLCVFGD